MLPSHAAVLRTVVCLAVLAAGPRAVADYPVLPDGVTRVASVEGVTEFKLDNGLRVLLIPDLSQPKVTVNMTVLVGSRHEGYGEAGMAHLLEHMLFKGCPKYPDIPKALRDHGASFNGSTWVDRTNYYETMPVTADLGMDKNLAFGIALEADRLANSFIRREDLLSEFTVVRNEFEYGENDPERVLTQRMFAAAFEWHNYGKSTIGNRSDIERVPVENLRAFYKKYYRPANALLVVAGKFDEQHALNCTASFFGKLKNPRDPLPATYTEEPAQDGERQVTLRRVGTVGAVGAVFHVPAGADPDFPAVEVLARVLEAEPAGRLYKALVEARKATSVRASTYPLHDPGALEVTAKTEPGGVEAARDALVAAIDDLAARPVTDDEVERARRQLLRSREQLLANSQAFALQLGEWEACGSWKLFFLHRDRLEKVTAADVNRVAGRYLVRSNRTVGVYAPTVAPERAVIPPRTDIAKLVEGYKGRGAPAGGEAFDPTPENVEKRVTRGTVGEGVKFAVLPKKTRGETVNLILRLRFGNDQSLKGLEAACDLVGPMLLRGTAKRTRQQIRDELDRLNVAPGLPHAGAAVFSSDLGVVTINLQTRRANLPAVLRLLGEVLREPTFPQEELDLLRREVLEKLEKDRSDPQALSMYALHRRTDPYPPGDVRYSPTVDEMIARVKAVSVSQVRDLYGTQLGGAAGELAIVGDVDPDAALAAVDGILKGWTAPTPYKRIEKAAGSAPGGRERIDTPDKANAVYAAGLTIPLSDADPEYPAVLVGNYLLGSAPLASRLGTRIRGKDGLSYGIGTNVTASALDKVGHFYVYALTNPKNMDRLDAAVAEEIGKFLAEGVGAAELEGAKKAYVQSLKGQRASDGRLAVQLAGALYAGRTFEYYADLERKIAAVRPADVKRAFDALIDLKRLVVIQAGDFGNK
jgi:zinc protease